MIRPKLLLALSVLAGAVLSACGVSEDSAPRPLTVGEIAPARNAARSEADLILSDISEELVVIYFDRNQDDLEIAEVLRFASQPVTPEIIMDFLLEGPSEEEAEEGFVSYLPIPDDLLGMRIEGDVLALNFRRGGRLEELSGLQSYLAAGQLVLSLSSNSSIEGVLVEIEGSPIALASEEGDLRRPARREDYDDLLENKSFTLTDLLSPPSFPPIEEAEIEIPGIGSDGGFPDDLGRETP